MWVRTDGTLAQHLAYEKTSSLLVAKLAVLLYVTEDAGEGLSEIFHSVISVV